MIPVGEHGLGCLDGSDYSAIPLILQKNAAATDSSLNSINDVLDAYNVRSWAVTTATGTTTGSSNTNELVEGSTAPNFSLLTGALTTQSFGMTGAPDFFPQLLAPGWYLAGGMATFQATGAVTANSRRDLTLEWSYSVGGINFLNYALNTVYESNTGGDALVVTGMFHADGVTRYFLDLRFAHRNTASTMQVNAGAKVWIAYIGSGLVI